MRWRLYDTVLTVFAVAWIAATMTEPTPVWVWVPLTIAVVAAFALGYLRCKEDDDEQ